MNHYHRAITTTSISLRFQSICFPLRGTNRVNDVRRRDNPAIQEDGDELDDHVEVEEYDDLFPPDRGVFGSDVVHHDQGHEDRGYVDDA